MLVIISITTCCSVVSLTFRIVRSAVRPQSVIYKSFQLPKQLALSALRFFPLLRVTSFIESDTEATEDCTQAQRSCSVKPVIIRLLNGEFLNETLIASARLAWRRTASLEIAQEIVISPFLRQMPRQLHSSAFST